MLNYRMPQYDIKEIQQMHLGDQYRVLLEMVTKINAYDAMFNRQTNDYYNEFKKPFSVTSKSNFYSGGTLFGKFVPFFN